MLAVYVKSKNRIEISKNLFRKSDITGIRADADKLLVHTDHYKFISRTKFSRPLDDIKFLPLKSVKDIAKKLKIGHVVLTNANGAYESSITMKGKIESITDDGFLIANNFRGHENKNESKSRFRYLWFIGNKNNKAKIVILNENALSQECDVCKKTTTDWLPQADLNDAINSIICDSCAKKNVDLIVCQECNVVHHKKDIQTINHKFYCNTCAELLFFTCRGCATVFSRVNLNIGEDGDFYCSVCYHERFHSCPRCLQTRRRDSFLLDEDTRQMICAQCYENIYGRIIKEYTFSPVFTPQKMKWEKQIFQDILYMGIELEIQHTNAKTLAKELTKRLKAMEINDFFYLKKDGSVPNGFEIVTQPLTLPWIHKNLKLYELLKWLKQEKTATEDGVTGFHVHLNKNFFSDIDIVKMRLFFKNNESQLKTFSHRKKNRSMDSGHGINPFAYCRFEEFTPKELLKNPAQHDRYWALNLNSSKNTIEIRLFNSTLEHPRVIANLQFCDAISNFIQNNGLITLFNANNWSLFTNWCNQQGRYTVLLEELKGDNLYVPNNCKK